MPNIADLIERRSKALADAQLIATAQGDLTTETRTKFQGFMTEADGLDADIKLLQHAEKESAEQRSRQANRPQPGSPESRVEEIRASFRNYLATGMIEKRDLTTSNQGVMIPQLFNSTVISAQKSYGEVYDLVNVLKTDNGDPMKMVLDNDTNAGLLPVTVGTSAPEADPSTSGLLLQVGNYTTGVIRVDNGLMADAGFDIEKWIRDKFLKRFFRGASSLIVNGDGANVASLLAAYSGTGVTSATAGALGYADFVAAQVALDPAYASDAAWAMNNAALGAVISIMDGNKRPIFLPDYGAADKGFVGSILGRPVKLVTQMPNVASGATPILYGNFSEAYTFRQQNPGIGILRLNELYAAGFETGFVGFARVGGVATDAGTHPVISLGVK